MYNHHLAVSVFISNMPQRTTKGCQLNKVLDKQWVVHNFFFTPTKNRPQLMISGALNKKREKRLEGNNPMSKKKTAEFPISASLLFSWIFNSSTSQEWLPELPGFTTRL